MTNHLNKIIIDYLSCKASQSELEELQAWLDERSENQQIFNRLCTDLLEDRLKPLSVDCGKAYRNVRRRTRRKMLRRIATWSSSVAAVIFVGLGIWTFFNSQQLNKKQVASVASGIVLTLPDGQQMALNRDGLNVGDSVQLSVDKDGTLQFSTRNTTDQYYEISVDGGPEQTLQLEDGTKVWIANRSKLRFPSHFSQHQRGVEASGELYFEVTHDEQRPFTVNVNGSAIRVLGTQFLIQSTTDKIVTTLIDGSVRFTAANGKNVTLKPNTQVESSDGELLVREIDPQFYTALRDGFFEFELTSIEQIAKMLEIRYECTIEIQNPDVAAARITARIKRYDKIEPIMELLSKVGNFTYHRKGGCMIID